MFNFYILVFSNVIDNKNKLKQFRTVFYDYLVYILSIVAGGFLHT